MDTLVEAKKGFHHGSMLSPNYSFEFRFEQQFKYADKRQWMQDNWHSAFYWIALYMTLVFGGQAFMSNRPPFKLKRLLVVWNIMLAIFSILGAFRTLPEMIHILRKFGFYHSVCNPSYIEITKVSGFWTWMFALSKVPELGDTIFIVFRKQNLIFLHWYHHITVLVFTWYAYGQHIAPARWYVCMNYLVHSFMYSYYATRSLGWRLPRFLAMSITTAQIMQMIVGCYVTYYGYQRQKEGICQMTTGAAKWGLLMYGSYFVLFANFFINSYLSKSYNRSLAKKRIDDSAFVSGDSSSALIRKSKKE
ncbi:very long chain fatty acid elongase 6-like [Brevipalpus obovatus]|uniref:very long chain fatty acid elongase 6-like n=1 Tax=Brevipalpus obovatus TaxID=246614 RepID=UPI003D9DE0B1